jgi:hypothetical protein
MPFSQYHVFANMFTVYQYLDAPSSLGRVEESFVELHLQGLVLLLCVTILPRQSAPINLDDCTMNCLHLVDS